MANQHTSTTVSHAQAESEQRSNDRSLRERFRRIALGLGPIGAASAMVVHPHAGDEPFAAISAAADLWLLVHVILFGSLTLLGVGTYLLAARIPGRTGLTGRIGAGVFTLFYVGYVAMVGLASGLIVRAGVGLTPAEQAGINAALEYLLTQPGVMGVAVIGTLGFLIAIAAIAFGYRRRVDAVAPLALLFGGVVALGVHSGLVAVAGMVGFLIGAAWIETAVSHRGSA